MPSSIVNNFKPAFIEKIGIDISETLLSSGIAGELRVSNTDNLTGSALDLTDTAVKKLICNEIEIPENIQYIVAPMLLGARLEFSLTLEEKLLSDDVVLFAQSHKKNMYWIANDTYDRLFASASPYVFATDGTYAVELDNTYVQSAQYAATITSIYNRQKNSSAMMS